MKQKFSVALVKVEDKYMLMIESAPVVTMVRLTAAQVREVGEALQEAADKIDDTDANDDIGRLFS